MAARSSGDTADGDLNFMKKFYRNLSLSFEILDLIRTNARA